MGSTRQLTCTLHLLAALAPLSAWRVPAKPKPADPFKKAPRKPPAVKMESGFDDDGEARGAGPDTVPLLAQPLFAPLVQVGIWSPSPLKTAAPSSNVG